MKDHVKSGCLLTLLVPLPCLDIPVTFDPVDLLWQLSICLQDVSVSHWPSDT